MLIGISGQSSDNLKDGKCWLQVLLGSRELLPAQPGDGGVVAWLEDYADLLCSGMYRVLPRIFSKSFQALPLHKPFVHFLTLPSTILVHRVHRWVQ